MSRLLFAAALALVALAPSSAGATGAVATTITTSDQARLAAYDENRVAAIHEAHGAAAADIAVLDTVLAGPPLSIRGIDIRGDYRCRTIKLGGNPPLVVYGWFACRIDEDGIGYHLLKTTGSQRLSGHFIDDSDTRLIFYGAGHYADETPRAYKSDPDSDMVGYLVKAGPGRYRLELPQPKLESNFDILELVKR